MCPIMLVFFDSRFAIFIHWQVGALGSRSITVVHGPPTDAGYVGSMGLGGCYWIMGGSPEYLIPLQW